MNYQTLFIGSLKINLYSPVKIALSSEEKLFSYKNICKKKENTIQIMFVEKITDEFPKLTYSSKSMRVIKVEDIEHRFYTSYYLTDQTPATYSRYDGKTVEVYHEFFRGLWYNPNFSILTHIHLEQLLLEADALILHSCYTEYKGKAILFTAPSGTGKTTQAEIWKRIYGSSIVNGDKCLLQKYEDTFWACGFFLHGSAPECENKSMPIHAIVIVRQSKRDYVEELNPMQKVALLYSEITVNRWNPAFVDKTMNLLEDLVQKIRVIVLHCTMEDTAAHVLHDYLFGGEDGII